MVDTKQSKQYAFVVQQLTAREIKRKYARSYLGILWSVLTPLLSMVVLYLIFFTAIPAFHRQLSHLLPDRLSPMANLHRGNHRRYDRPCRQQDAIA